PARQGCETVFIYLVTHTVRFSALRREQTDDRLPAPVKLSCESNGTPGGLLLQELTENRYRMPIKFTDPSLLCLPDQFVIGEIWSPFGGTLCSRVKFNLRRFDQEYPPKKSASSRSLKILKGCGIDADTVFIGKIPNDSFGCWIDSCSDNNHPVVAIHGFRDIDAKTLPKCLQESRSSYIIIGNLPNPLMPQLRHPR